MPPRFLLAASSVDSVNVLALDAVRINPHYHEEILEGDVIHALQRQLDAHESLIMQLSAQIQALESQAAEAAEAALAREEELNKHNNVSTAIAKRLR